MLTHESWEIGQLMKQLMTGSNCESAKWTSERNPVSSRYTVCVGCLLKWQLAQPGLPAGLLAGLLMGTSVADTSPSLCFDFYWICAPAMIPLTGLPHIVNDICDFNSLSDWFLWAAWLQILLPSTMSVTQKQSMLGTEWGFVKTWSSQLVKPPLIHTLQTDKFAQIIQSPHRLTTRQLVISLCNWALECH